MHGASGVRRNFDILPTRRHMAPALKMPENRTPLILIVLDGFGCRKETEWNAIAAGGHAALRSAVPRSPWTTLEASGRAVGLPRGQMGNSEVGHLNIGAGRDRRSGHRPHRQSGRAHEIWTRIRCSSIDAGEADGAVHFAGLALRRRRAFAAVASARTDRRRNLHVAAAEGMSYSSTPSSTAATRRRSPPRSTRELLDVHRATNRRRIWPRSSAATSRWTATSVGSRAARLRPDDARRRHARRRIRSETVRRFYEQNVTDEFMEPIAVLDRDGAHLGRDRRRRRAGLLQLPRGPDAPDRHGVQGRRISTASIAPCVRRRIWSR